ncbi:MAG: 50S ribosomal protein L23 [Candidatus Paceibacterota bacterium]
MATTKTKKNTKEVVESKEKTHILIKGPRITEKSAIDAERGVYTFNVAQTANKNELKKAIKFVYGVTPERISVTTIAKKTVTRRGIVSVKQGGKKAVVHLKKGDKITFA